MIYHGNNIEILKTFADNSADSIVTDPPYGLSFMNKHWDYDVPSVELWKECLRVLKPGGHLLSFAGTRTYHRMTVRIEDAGFEIRDMISWIYGSGFPKSLDIGKAIDKMKGVEREVIGKSIHSANRVKDIGYLGTGHSEPERLETAPATPEAIQWNGWGTALKPACEPICVARKPVHGTIANNVLEYGTGGINIDGCRIGTEDNLNGGAYSNSKDGMSQNEIYGKYYKKPDQYKQPQGRFPANIIFDEIAGVLLDEQSGISESRAGNPNRKNHKKNGNTYFSDKTVGQEHNDKGGASRFFYCAKASKAERNGGLEGFEEKGIEIQQPHNSKDLEQRYEMKSKNFHPTVKPLKLMQYLVRLVTPPNGICIDPFCGSGTTLMACVKEGFNYIGIEREADYVKIAEARIEWIKKQVKETPEQTNLFTPIQINP